MTCFFCKDEMEPGFTTHLAELPNCIVIIKNVPCMQCCQCGETVYTAGVVKNLEKIVQSVQNLVTEIAVLNYADQVA